MDYLSSTTFTILRKRPDSLSLETSKVNPENQREHFDKNIYVGGTTPFGFEYFFLYIMSLIIGVDSVGLRLLHSLGRPRGSSQLKSLRLWTDVDVFVGDHSGKIDLGGMTWYSPLVFTDRKNVLILWLKYRDDYYFDSVWIRWKGEGKDCNINGFYFYKQEKGRGEKGGRTESLNLRR